jgi:trimethylamine--corrinoid protein Co-methyltransferase
MAALAGANLIYGMGMLEMGMTVSLPQLVMDNEFTSMVKYSIQGIPVTDESLSVEVIKDVGASGDFLSHDQTLKYMRSLPSKAKLIDRRKRIFWEESGGWDIAQRAQEEAKSLLKTHKPDPLTNDVIQSLRKIVAEAEKELCST